MIALLSLSSAYAQVPTDSLVGYWPFNGNANDESGNLNNGTVNGATLCPDRFGNANSAYSFDGVSNDIFINNSPSINSITNGITISEWVNTISANEQIFLSKRENNDQNIHYVINLKNNKLLFCFSSDPINYPNYSVYYTSQNPSAILRDGNWHNITITHVYGTNNTHIYIDNTEWSGVWQWASPLFPATGLSSDMHIGKQTGASPGYTTGKIDDIRIYKRALDSAEITSLYNEGLCYQTITVTDTLIINTTFTGFNPVKFLNTIKIFPNPTYDHITIDYGNYNTMNGYTLKILNSIGQTVFTSPVNQQQSFIDISTWTGNGIYFVHLIDAQNNTIDVKKIILQ